MGLFNFGKKKETTKSPVSCDDSLGDIAVKLAKAGVISVPKDDNHNTFGEKLDRLVNGELPWGWVTAKAKFIEPRDKKLTDLHIRACSAKSVVEERYFIEEFLAAFQAYRNECEKLGECYVKYFSDMHSSLCGPREERLAYLNENYDALVADEEKKSKALLTLSTDIENMIQSQPGILQSELIKQFDPLVKSEITDLLYHWTQDGRITREKQGRTYALTMK